MNENTVSLPAVEHDTLCATRHPLGTTPGEPSPQTFERAFSLDIARYQLIVEIGRGGMGSVYIARDHTLNRAVAVKVLRDDFATDSSTAARFVEEAQITSQLQHPGIPAIYDSGRMGNDRPYLAMKLIKGRTLDQLLQSGEPINVLAVFEAVAQAVGYAHAHGVIHRDLKPHNIMVGAFGEVQVMDWGLAKLLASGGRQPAVSDSQATEELTEIRNPRDGESPYTHTGSILGTPAYMPPEQAAGMMDHVNECSDVFGLGAILCQMLCGVPPFSGKDSESTRRNAVRGLMDEAMAKLSACDADPDVAALCRKCLSFEPGERPANAGEVAKQVAGLRAAADERARQADLEKARAEVLAAEQRKRRRVQQIAGGSLAAVLLLGIAGTTYGLFRAEGKEHDALIAAEQERLAKEREAEQRSAADLARDQARKRYQLALEAFEDMVNGIQMKLKTRPDTQDLRKDLLENARKGLKKLLEEAKKQGNPDSTMAWSYFRMGDVELSLGNTVAADKEYRAGYELSQRLAEADPKNSVTQRDLSTGYNKLGDVTLQLGQTKDAFRFYEKGLLLAELLAEADPKNATAQRDLSFSYDKLGDVTLQLGQTKEALRYYEKLLSVRQRLAEADPKNAEIQRDLSACYSRLGDVTLQLGQTMESLGFYEKFMVVSQRLVEADPKNTVFQGSLGASYSRLGDVTLQWGQTKDALGFFKKSLAVFQRLAEADPKNTTAQSNLSASYSRLGRVMLRVGQTQDAHGFFEKTVAINQRLAEADLKNAVAQSELGISYNNLALVTLQLGQTKEALGFYEKSLAVFQRLAEADPKNALAQRYLGVSYNNLGDATLKSGQTMQALGFFEKSLAVFQRLTEADPKNAEAHRDLSSSYEKLGNVHKDLMQYEPAIHWYRQSEALARQWVGKFQWNFQYGQQQIAACEAAMKLREIAPPPRVAKP